ncbi:TniQ family protein [Paraburkholderia ginsengisoli]|uniref:TniQ domain-containing protein n=1 Tax=Paraburkholderia ginsengisoli TaxID=311231 RepID=A0A7T4N0W9_9BURK|nr:TniQ family protein [Paraburkholderia ginsengisoli]QQC63164.1 hypothetical protein I6I06_12705 [Paraburkholderia ginsengisoli]
MMGKNTPPSSLPAPVQEETLASWLDRVYIHSDSFHRRANRRSVLGAPWRNVSGLLPYRLRVFADSVGQHFYSDTELLTLHTFYPYFAATMTDTAGRDLAERIFSGGRGPLCPTREPLSLAARPDVGRYCLQCQREDRISLGFDVGRRYNVAPFVTRCPFHGDFISVLSDGVERDLASFRWKESQSATTRRNAQQFARETQRLLEGCGATLMTCRHRLEAMGYMTKEGSLRVKQLVDESRAHFADGFEDQALSRLVADKEMLRRAFQRLSDTRRSIHPAYLILLNLFTEAHSSDVPTSEKTEPSGVWRHEDLRKSAVEGCSSVTAVARKLGVATTTATLLLRRAGLADRFNVRQPDDGIAAILRDLEAATPVASVAAHHGVTPLRVYRLMRTAPGLIERRRERAYVAELKLRRSTAEAARTTDGRVITAAEFRGTYRNDYCWLLKHDKEWLRVYLATLTRSAVSASRTGRSSLTVEAAASEIELLRRAYDSATQIDERRPYRASRKRVAKTLKLNDYAVKIRKELGLLVPAEDDEAFVRRRIEWVKNLSPDLNIGSSERWLKKAGLRRTKNRRSICVAAARENVDA